MAGLEIHQFLCRTDNFCVLLHDPSSGLTAAVDAPHGPTILSELANKGWSLTHLFITHHHYDHTDGNLELKEKTGCRIIGAKADRHRINGLDEGVREGDVVKFGAYDVEVLETPGHTSGHVSYYWPQARLVFTGDTVFSMGCGRLFEGTAEQMYASCRKIAALPPDTQLYCGHEYTLNNAEFALEVDPENAALQARLEEVKALRRSRKFTLPVSLELEKATNPFLRTSEPSLQQSLGMSGRPETEIFAELRRRKDRF